MEYRNAKIRKQISLRPDSILNQRLVDALDDLFTAIPPVKLKHRIHEMYLWLHASDVRSPELLKEITMDYSLLFHFLDMADEYRKEREPESDPANLSGKAEYTKEVRAQMVKLRQCLELAAGEEQGKTIGQFYAQLTLIQVLARQAGELMR